MAYDEALADRVRTFLAERPGVVEKKMFGGLGFLVQGNMACGVHKDMLVVRVGPEHYEESMQLPYTRPFDMTGRAMKGWIMVTAEGMASEADFRDWVKQGVEFALSLPPK